MIRLAVFIATTDGPAQIQRISRERAPLSMIIRGSGSERLPISDRYDDFARPGSGPVDRYFGPFPEGGFRLEVSEPINSGASWQLGVFLAHAVETGDGFELVRKDPTLEDCADHIIWMTGQVDYDGQVSDVGHIQEKFYASRNALATWLESRIRVTLVVPAGDDHQRLLDSDLPAGADIIAAKDAVALCQEFGINFNTSTRPAVRSPSGASAKAQGVRNRILVALGIILFAGFFFVAFTAGQLDNLMTWSERLTALFANQKDNLSKTEFSQEVTTQTSVVSVGVHERRAPVGASCADVHIGDVAAIELPVSTDANGQHKASRAANLCGLLLLVDPGPKPHYLRAELTMLRGRLIDANRTPEALSGNHRVRGPQRWVLVLPFNEYGHVHYRLTVQASEMTSIDEASTANFNSITLEHAILTD